MAPVEALSEILQHGGNPEPAEHCTLHRGSFEYPLFVRRLASTLDLADLEKSVLADALKSGPVFEPDSAIEPPAGGLMVLTTGLVSTSVMSPDGARRIFAFYVPGDVLNLAGFLLRHPGGALAAVSKCKVDFVPAAAITLLMERFPAIQECLSRQLGLEIEISRKWLEPRKPPEAIAHLYCELYMRHLIVGLVQHREPLALHLTQKHLADALGSSLVHTNKSARLLRARGWLEFAVGQHKILNFDELAIFSGFSPDYICSPAGEWNISATRFGGTSHVKMV